MPNQLEIAMTTTLDTNRQVADTMTAIRNGENEEELFFNPRTGQLVVRRPGQEPNDAQPATEMAREGFFGGDDPPVGTDVGTALRRINDDCSDEELIFEPETGRLLVRRSGDALPEGMPATAMAREGFFMTGRHPRRPWTRSR
jgi:hypothetical protein